MDRNFLSGHGSAGEASRLEMQWKEFGHRMMVDAGLMLEPEFMVSDQAGFLMDQIMIGMRTRILTDNLPPEVVTETTTVRVEEPASTWQMWKRNNQGRWYTKWWLVKWLAKWPVIMKGHDKRITMSVDLERFRTYPEARYRASDFGLGRAVLLHSISPVSWRYEDYGPSIGSGYQSHKGDDE